MSLSDCTPCCSTPVSTAVPGPQGASAVTATTASFVIPAIGSTVAIAVGSTAYFLQGENVFIGDGSKFGNFLITAINSAVGLTVRFLGFVGDSAAASTIASGALVTASIGNYTVPWDMDTFTAFTDNSGGTKSDTIAATVARSVVTVGPFLMTAVVNAQSWGIAIPFNFALVSALMRCDIAMTSGGASAGTFTSRIGGVAVTGGVIAAAGAYATGATQAGSAVTGTNTGTAGQVLDLLLSGITVWTAGYAHFEFVLTNTDLNATVAATADKINTLRTRLRHA